ncbi:cellulase family glycosylhydrolase [Massilia sp. LXY-6]|uniref:cellulase family glycosylhydrolase n=1 Tax=Massilia sp. LXY-6 TaxID=3379823 RepID=UPI003EE3CAC5
MKRLRRHMAALCLRYCARLLTCAVLGGIAMPALAQKGINGNELYELTESDLTATIADYKRLGVKWVRFDFDWSVIEPARGHYVYERYDNVVERLAKAEIHVLGLIAYTPSWANGGKRGKFHPPLEPGVYAEFAAHLAARYAAKGVHAWEIWNEPNLGQFWGNAPDPAAYTKLLRRAYAAIKKADPKALVVSGGLAQPATTATSIESLNFLMAMYQNGAHGFFDALGNHPYTSPRIPGDWMAHNWRKMALTSPSLLSIMKEHGDGDKKIWITEFGAPTGGKSPWGTVIDENQQARMVERTFAEASSVAWAGPVFWYNYRDFCHYKPGADSECFYGLIRFDRSPKPAFEKFRLSR